MEEKLRVYRFPQGEVQRIQTVRLQSWEELAFFRPRPANTALQRFAAIYRRYLVPACPWLFGSLVLVPADAAPVLRQGVRLRRGKPVFSTPEARSLWHSLQAENSLALVRGRLPVAQIIGVGALCGDLTAQEPARLLCNGSFFIMDSFDCATVYDTIGTPLGLLVKDGIVENPPLYGREALLVDRSGRVTVRPVSLEELTLEIGEQCYRPGDNARVYTRPRRSRTPYQRENCLVIVGNQVVDVRRGRIPIPASGFVLCPCGGCTAAPGARVTYRGLEQIRFGIQVGNSILVDGVPTQRFHSRFYNIRRLEPVPYPPSLYPMDFQRARAARMALGADEQGRPILLWAEGAAKVGHTPGVDSQGATMAEMIRYCQDAGMTQAIHLDGGGSAQLLLQGKRSLHLSDRTPSGEEVERPVPLALRIQ